MADDAALKEREEARRAEREERKADREMQREIEKERADVQRSQIDLQRSQIEAQKLTQSREIKQHCYREAEQTLLRSGRTPMVEEVLAEAKKLEAYYGV